VLFVSLIAHRIFRRAEAGGRYLASFIFTRACLSPRRSIESSRRYFQLGSASRGRRDSQKITRSFVHARQFTRSRIQSVTNGERRRNSGRCGFSSELANAALRRGEYKSGHAVCGCRIYISVYTHLGFLPSLLPIPFPSPGVPVRFCLPATDRDVPEVAATNVRPPTIDRGSPSTRRDRLLRFALSRETRQP